MWANGSDHKLNEHVREFADEKHKLPFAENRDRGELRYAIRSLLHHSSAWLGNIYIVSLSLGAELEKQIPNWLDINADIAKQKIKIIGSKELYTDIDLCLPIFNIKGIAAQVKNLPKVVPAVSKQILFMRESMILGDDFSTTDIFSGLFGSTLSFVADVNWYLKGFRQPHRTTISSGKEYDRAIYSQWLLNRRFCDRKRHLPSHTPHSIDLSVMKEALESFPQALFETAHQRFSGVTPELHVAFTSLHYVIERHREVLIWSYISQRMDKNQDGNIDASELAAIKTDIFQGKRSRRERAPVLKDIEVILQDTNTPVFTRMTPRWTSLDGPYYLESLHNRRCEMLINIDDCFDLGHRTTESKVIVQSLAAHAICGDCMLHYLLNLSDKGLDPVLPPRDHPNLANVIKAIRRYSYVIADSQSVFVRSHGIEEMRRNFADISYVDGYLELSDDINRQLSFGEEAEIAGLHQDLGDALLPYDTTIELN
jgi:hypothetical protein